MSHFVETKLNISNQSHLFSALRDMGYELKVGRHIMPNGYGQKRTVDFSLKGYPIGFVKKGENYEIVADWWGTGLNRVDFANKLQQNYAKYQVIEVCRKAGLTPGQWVEKEDGTLEMVAVKRSWG